MYLHKMRFTLIGRVGPHEAVAQAALEIDGTAWYRITMRRGAGGSFHLLTTHTVHAQVRQRHNAGTVVPWSALVCKQFDARYLALAYGGLHLLGATHKHKLLHGGHRIASIMYGGIHHDAVLAFMIEPLGIEHQHQTVATFYSRIGTLGVNETVYALRVEQNA